AVARPEISRPRISPQPSHRRGQAVSTSGKLLESDHELTYQTSSALATVSPESFERTWEQRFSLAAADARRDALAECDIRLRTALCRMSTEGARRIGVLRNHAIRRDGARRRARVCADRDEHRSAAYRAGREVHRQSRSS